MFTIQVPTLNKKRREFVHFFIKIVVAVFDKTKKHLLRIEM